MAGKLILPPSAASQGRRQCSSHGCLHVAEWVPKLCVPPKGFAPDAGRHLSCIIGLPLCEDCFVPLKPEQIINDTIHAHFEAVLKTKGAGAPPLAYNFAFILPVPIDGPEYRAWERTHRRNLILQ
jgi:hypothetical protein